MEQTTKVILDLQYAANSRGIDIDCFELANKLYEKHRDLYGSFTRYLGDGDSYQHAMNQRYDYIVCNINETIEALLTDK